MKLIYTLAAMLFASISAPALADEAWDMQSNAAPQIQQQVVASQLALPVNTNDGNIQWDTSAMNNSQAAAAQQLYLEQLAYEEQHRHHQQVTSQPTGTQAVSNLPVCQTALMSPGGLQATTLDSFVMNAGGNAENIYGDEGTSDIPPLFGFTEGNTINAGIQGNLTTGHASGLPSAWTSY